MALTSTIYKADLTLADMDRHYYESHQITIAQHPSETLERMMVRVLAFALNANEGLKFGRGISTDEDPDVYQETLSGDIELWIDLGQPDEKRVKKASQRSKQAVIFSHQTGPGRVWWEKNKTTLSSYKNLSVFLLPDGAAQQLASFAARTMQLNLTIQDGLILITNGEQSMELSLETLL